MINFKKYIGKSICINRNNCPVYLFNVQNYYSDIKVLVAEQIIDSSRLSRLSATSLAELKVFNGKSICIDPKYDTVSIVCDTPDELFADVVKYLKEQIKNRSGLQLS